MKSVLLVTFVLLVTVVAACGRDVSRQTVGDLVVTFSTEPNPVRVGEALLKVRITAKGGIPISPSAVRFHYYPFVFRVKDSLASPDEVVRVADASPDQDGYSAKVTFEKPGPWKVTVKIIRPEKPDTLVTFTLDVRG